MVETDYFVRMGRTHSICQDYAVAGLSAGRPYAILSDGCSGKPLKGDPGSPHTDFGSRFLVRAASHHLGDLFEGDRFPMSAVATEALGMVRQVGLPRASLDATLLAMVQKGRYVRTYQMGDGVVAAKQRDGSLFYCTVKFGENMPYYLSYSLNRDQEATYVSQAKTATMTTRRRDPKDGWGVAVEHVEDLNEFRPCQTRLFDIDETEAVVILSDGAESFMKRGTTEAVSLEAVLEHVLAFKNYEGEFITRRLNAFLTRHCVQEDWVHGDDFSCAGIYLGKTDNP